MKRFLRRLIYFSLPFVLLTVFVGVVDPFDCLGFSQLVPDSVKTSTAEPLHNPLWKIQKFRSSPVNRLILGDSSMASINVNDLRAATGQQYFNFAYGGGTVVEAIDTYWFAADRTHLDAVYLGIGLINFNEYQNLNRVPEAEVMVANPAKYLTNRIVVGAALVSAYTELMGPSYSPGSTPMSRENFWREQLDEGLPQMLHEYQYPATVAGQLESVAADCRKRGTRLILVIPPTHLELQKKIVALGRGADQARFKLFLAGLGEVYDLDYPNEFTAERENFSDPFHTVNDHMIIAEVWQGRGLFSRHTLPP